MSDAITAFFRAGQVRALKRTIDGNDAVLLVRGFGVEAGRNESVPLYASLAAIADHLSAGDYPELR